MQRDHYLVLLIRSSSSGGISRGGLADFFGHAKHDGDDPVLAAREVYVTPHSRFLRDPR